MKQIRVISLCLLLCAAFTALKAQVKHPILMEIIAVTAYNIKMKGELNAFTKDGLSFTQRRVNGSCT